MLESIRITKEEIGREAAAVYPDWLDGEYEFEYKFDVHTGAARQAIIHPATDKR